MQEARKPGLQRAQLNNKSYRSLGRNSQKWLYQEIEGKWSPANSFYSLQESAGGNPIKPSLYFGREISPIGSCV